MIVYDNDAFISCDTCGTNTRHENTGTTSERPYLDYSPVRDAVTLKRKPTAPPKPKPTNFTYNAERWQCVECGDLRDYGNA